MLTRGKTVEVLAYTAGLLDGEGCIGISYISPARPGLARKYAATIAVGSTDQELIRWLQEEWGGSVYPKTKTKPEYRDVWGWSVSHNATYQLLLLVLPYLRTKKRQAELVIRFCERKKRYNRQITQDPLTGRIIAHPGAPVEETAWRESIVRQIRALNSQPQRLSETASRPEEAIV